jgi:hypothetical protein
MEHFEYRQIESQVALILPRSPEIFVYDAQKINKKETLNSFEFSVRAQTEASG